MNRNFQMDWDKLTDVLYIKANHVDDRDIVNVDSQKYPGVVKRMHASTGECVGFMIHDFSFRFRDDAKKSEDEIKNLLIQSIHDTTQADFKTTLPMSA